MSSENELKELQTRLVKINSELRSTEKELANKANRRNTLIEKSQAIEIQINKLLKKEPVVTEHAILRFIERIGKADIDEIKKRILPEVVKEAIMQLGDGKYPVNNEFKIIVKNNMVVTVEPN